MIKMNTLSDIEKIFALKKSVIAAILLFAVKLFYDNVVIKNYR